MKYCAQMDCRSEADIDFSSVESTLIPIGFRVIKKDKASITLIGRGMNSTKEDPIRGATEISITANSGALRLNANLGGVLFMSLFLCFFPPLLIVAVSYFNSSNSSVINHLWVWFVIGPMIAYFVRRRTIKALDIMFENSFSK